MLEFQKKTCQITQVPMFKSYCYIYYVISGPPEKKYGDTGSTPCFDRIFHFWVIYLTQQFSKFFLSLRLYPPHMSRDFPASLHLLEFPHSETAVIQDKIPSRFLVFPQKSRRFRSSSNFNVQKLSLYLSIFVRNMRIEINSLCTLNFQALKAVHPI